MMSLTPSTGEHSGSRVNSKGAVYVIALLSMAFFAPGAIPAPWVAADINTPGQAGSSTFDPANANWVVQGGGDDIWNTADKFRYVYISVSGDCVITARGTALTDSAGGTTNDAWSKAGVMIRDGTAGGAMYAFECITGGNGTAMQYRTTTGGGPGSPGQTGGGALHRWVRMIRTGNNFQGAYSDDGTTWTNQGAAVAITMPAAALVGLACCAHNDGTTAIATFDSLTVTNGTGGVIWPLPPPVVASPPTPGYNAITLSWTAVPNAVTYNILRGTVSGGPYTQIATVNAPTTTYIDNTASYPTTYFYVVTASAPTIGTSAFSNQVSQTPLQPPIAVNTSSLQTVEGGAPVAFNILFNAPIQSGQSVTLTIQSNVGTEGQVASSGKPAAPAVSAQTITLDPIVGPQAAGLTIPVLVYGIDDASVDGDQPYTVTVSYSATPAGVFTGFPNPTIAFTNVDNDVAGIAVSRTSGLITTEGGGQDSFSITLTTSPSSPLTLNFVSSNTAEGTVSPPSYQFTSANYNQPHVVTITGVDDTALDFNIPYQITITKAGGGPAEYAAVTPPNVSVTNLDDEVPPALDHVWGGGCGLTGLEAGLALLAASLFRRRRR